MGWTPQLVRIVCVVLTLCINGVSANEDDDSGAGAGLAVLGIFVFIVKVAVIACLVMKCVNARNAQAQAVVYTTQQPALGQGQVQRPQSIVDRATQRLADQATHRHSGATAPSLPDGRYDGSRSLGSFAAREPVEYNLTFANDGTVNGTLTVTNDQSTAGVFGWYHPLKQEFQWVETNVTSFEGTTYLAKLADIARPEYNGPEKLTEVSVRVVDGSVISLVGDYASSSGGQGDLRLIHKPGTEEASSSVSVSIPPFSMDKEAKEAKLEPTLEKESL